MSDYEKVLAATLLSLALLGGAWWLPSDEFPILKSETAFATLLPVFIGLAVLIPALRGRYK